MEAKNFRIGNLLTSKQWDGIGAIEGIEVVKDGWELKVKGYVHNWEKGKYFDLKPIPLTTEWLMKFGFNIIGVNAELGKLALWKSDYDGNYHFRYTNDLRDWVCLEYVHQLQNLFFALMEKELELKNDISTCG